MVSHKLCQPFSVAGKRKGVADDRNMWPETIRIVRLCRPKYVFLENVPGLLSARVDCEVERKVLGDPSKISVPYFGTILRDLFEVGYDAKWACISAKDCGAPHKRERLWIVAYSNSSGSRQDTQ
ncbi:MAG TPA: DNA cytosine methyltransferase [Desulfobacterales bacterium]|nr:DNA cytosine methyltransferase [Desulfobacterales bacterium]